MSEANTDTYISNCTCGNCILHDSFSYSDYDIGIYRDCSLTLSADMDIQVSEEQPQPHSQDHRTIETAMATNIATNRAILSNLFACYYPIEQNTNHNIDNSICNSNKRSEEIAMFKNNDCIDSICVLRNLIGFMDPTYMFASIDIAFEDVLNIITTLDGTIAAIDEGTISNKMLTLVIIAANCIRMLTQDIDIGRALVAGMEKQVLCTDTSDKAAIYISNTNTVRSGITMSYSFRQSYRIRCEYYKILCYINAEYNTC